jgi:hypothetical protein
MSYVIRGGETKRIHQITLENVRQSLLAGGLLIDGEFDALWTDMDEFTARPDTTISFPRIFQVIARASFDDGGAE